VIARAVAITAARKIMYEIHSLSVDESIAKLPKFLNNILMIPDILMKFLNLRVCKGVTGLNNQNSYEKCIIQDNFSNLRHVKCTVLSISRERCNFCQKKNKVIAQRAKRAAKRDKFNRVQLNKNINDEKRLILKKRMKALSVRNRYLQNRVLNLKNSFEKIQNNMSNVPQSTIDGLPENEKLVLQEIVSAAQRKDSRGRRYTEEFIMLCILMNIRSRSYYEFIRKNEIMPLPCTKTVRQYISMRVMRLSSTSGMALGVA